MIGARKLFVLGQLVLRFGMCCGHLHRRHGGERDLNLKSRAERNSQRSSGTRPTQIPTQTFNIGTLNIVDGRNNRLEMALKAISDLNIDLAILTETKLGEVHTRLASGYDVWCAPVKDNLNQGGVALVHRRSSRWHLEDIKTFGSNIIRGKLIGGDRPLFIIGGYIPPSETDESTLAHLDRALNGLDTKNCIFLGDINVDLNFIKDARGETISTFFSCGGFLNVRNSFRMSEKNRGRHGWTWNKWVQGRLRTSVCDCILAGDPQIFKSVSLKTPAFDTDHRLIRGEIKLGKKVNKYRSYLRKRSRINPVSVEKEKSEADILLEKLREKATSEKISPTKKSSWISSKTHQLMEKKATAMRQGRLHRAKLIGKELRRKLRQDKRARTTGVSVEIERKLESGDTAGAFDALKGWYKDFGGKAPKPTEESLEEVRGTFESLYTPENENSEVGEGGLPFDIPYTSPSIPDGPPLEGEIIRE